MTAPDPVLVRVAEAVAANQRGESRRARTTLQTIWDEVGPARDPLHRCAIAHGLADAQDDAREELAWDLQALRAAGEVTDARAAAAGMGPAAAMLPSLHLNLADVHLRAGDGSSARRHVAEGMAALGRLPADGYGEMIRQGLERLQTRLRYKLGSLPGP